MFCLIFASFEDRRHPTWMRPSPNGVRKTDRSKSDNGRNYFRWQIHLEGPTPREQSVDLCMSDRPGAIDPTPRTTRLGWSHLHRSKGATNN
eukprot:scaffold585_cov330-Pavlova_lutheri.AAC.4